MRGTRDQHTKIANNASLAFPEFVLSASEFRLMGYENTITLWVMGLVALENFRWSNRGRTSGLNISTLGLIQK